MHMSQVESWIRDRAYSIWEQEGRPEGCERRHWEQAAREVMAGGVGSTAYRQAKQARASDPAEKTASPKSRNSRGRRSAA